VAVPSADMNVERSDTPVSSDGETRTRHIIRSTILMIFLFATAKVISLAQTFIIARTFGISKSYDAFVSASRIPELLVVLIAGGALNYAFIPVFSGLLAQGDRKKGWELASQLVNTVFGAALLVSSIVFILAPWLVSNVIAPGFDVATAAQTAELLRILLLGTIIFSVSGLVSGMLQSHNHFLLPSLSPIMYDLGILFGVVFLIKPFGLNGIAIGTVFGAILHLSIQIPGLIRFRARWSAQLGWRNPTFRRVLILMLPRIIGLGVFQINMLIMTNIGSRLSEGSISAIDWGWRLMQIPQTLIGTVMGIVIFPTLAALSALGDDVGKRTSFSGALRFILIASIPSALGLLLVGRNMIRLLERGAFDASASALVYSTLSAFTLGLIVHSIMEIAARAFYADKDTLTPLWAALGAAAINFVLAYLLSGIFQVEGDSFMHIVARMIPSLNLTDPRGSVGGLALANSLGTTFEVIVLLWVLRRRWHGIEEGQIITTTLKTLAASAAMGVTVVLVGTLWTALGLGSRSFVFIVVELGLQVVLGGLVFLGVGFALRMTELQDMLQRLLRRSPDKTKVVA